MRNSMAVLVLICCLQSIISPVHGSSIRTFEAVRTENPPKIDGHLTDPEWQTVQAQTTFINRNKPYRGQPAEAQSFLKILYDADNLYIGMEMAGENPDKMLRSITRRDDNIDNDDSLCIYIDSFHDHRSCYFFQVNLMGTQRDLASSNKGAQVDVGWDAIWFVQTAPQENGWSAEFKIPFKIFRFNWSENLTFGFDVIRISSQNKESSEWCYVEDNQSSSLNPQLYGDLTGIKNIKKPLFFQIVPEVAASNVQNNRDVDPDDDGTGWEKETDVQAGGDVVWNITSRMTLNATYNPDYAQIESDPDTLNLTGEEIVLEERRTFFRENNALFLSKSESNPFYSRRIVDIDSGLKLTGQVGNSDFAFLSCIGRDGTKESNIFNVLKLQTPWHDFTFCGWLTSKYNPECPIRNVTTIHGDHYDAIRSDYNNLAGFDLLYSKNPWQAMLNLFASYYPQEMRVWYTHAKSSDIAYLQLETQYYGTNWWAQFRYKDAGDSFYPEIGYVPASLIGNRIGSILYERTWHYQKSSNYKWTWFDLGMDYGVRSDDPEKLSKCIFYASSGLTLANDFECYFEYHLGEDRTYEKFRDFDRDENGEFLNPMAGYFYEHLGNGNTHINRLDLSINWTDGGWQGIGITGSCGHYYFSDIWKASFWARKKIESKFGIEFNLDYALQYDPTPAFQRSEPEWQQSETWIARSKLTYSYSQELYTRMIISGFIENQHFTDSYDLSLVLAYTFLPGSNAYLVYENSWTPFDFELDEYAGFGNSQLRSQKLYLKISYLFDI